MNNGIGIFIPGADFSGNNLGKVTPLQDVNITGLAIVANSSYTGTQAQLSVSYTPSNTNQTGVTWSITAGSDYASIDASSGLLTIKSGANASSVTVKAVSAYDNTIIATTTLSVTYSNTVDVLTSLTITGAATAESTQSQYAVTYNPTNTSKLGVVWSLDSGSSYASINSSTGLLTINTNASNSPVVIRATSSVDNTIYTTKNVVVSYKMSSWTLYGHPGGIANLNITPSAYTIYVELANVYGISALNADDNRNRYLISTTLAKDKNTYGMLDILLWSYAFQVDILNATNYREGTGKAATGEDYAHIFKSWGSWYNSDASKVKGFILNPDLISKIDNTGTLVSVDSTSWSTGKYGGGLFSKCLNIGVLEDSGSSPSEFSTDALLNAAITAGTCHGWDVDLEIKISKLIVYPSTKYHTAADAIANRANAWLDVQFDANGKPFNAGTGGTLVVAGY